MEVRDDPDRREAAHIPLRAAVLRRSVRPRGEAARRAGPAGQRRGDGDPAVPQRAPRRAGEAGDVPGGGCPPAPPPRPVSGTLNGTPFHTLADADPRIGARLEIFAAGQYTWIPLEQIASRAHCGRPSGCATSCGRRPSCAPRRSSGASSWAKCWCPRCRRTPGDTRTTPCVWAA